jgi:hypothetical protein
MGRRVDFTPGGKPATHGGSGHTYTNYGCRCDECRKANARRYQRRKAERQVLVDTGQIPDTVEHGSAATYNNWGCRCRRCTDAHIEKCRSDDARRAAKLAAGQAEPRYHNYVTYRTWHCRCDVCVADRRAWQRQYNRDRR